MAKTLTNQQKRDWAKLLYLKEGLQFQVIAEKVGVNRITVGRWAKEDNWEGLRQAYIMSQESTMQDAVMQLSELNKEINKRDVKTPTSAEADIISKLRKTIKEAKTGPMASDVIDMSSGFLRWLSEREPEKAAELSYYFDDYIKSLL